VLPHRSCVFAADAVIEKAKKNEKYINSLRVNFSIKQLLVDAQLKNFPCGATVHRLFDFNEKQFQKQPRPQRIYICLGIDRPQNA